MKLSHTPGAIKRFRRTPWKVQTTFATPLKNLTPFVTAITTAHEPFTSGRLTLDTVVFEPGNLLQLLVDHSLPPERGHDWMLTAEGLPKVQELLKAALSDWIDFMFVPGPKPFVIYADHDEYVTFFANNKSGLSRVTAELTKQGFKQVPDYERTF